MRGSSANIGKQRRAPRWRVPLLGALAFSFGCGARTTLEVDGSRTSTGGGAAPTGCPRVDDPTPVRTGDTVQFFGHIASDGCSFGASWGENRGGRVAVVATTFHVVDGAWQASPIVELGPVGGANNGPGIAWDGSAYLIAWADEVLLLRRMGPDGTLLGPAVPSFEAPGNVYVDWLDPASDGTLRVGLRSDVSGSYQIYFARVTLDGGVAVAPSALTDHEGVDTVGFVHESSVNTAVWTAGVGSAGRFILATRFDEEGVRLQTDLHILSGNLFGTRHGAARSGGDKYFGALLYSESPDLVIGRLVAPNAGWDPIPGAAGGDVPVLAATNRGTLGVLAASERPGPSDLELSIIEDGAVTSTSVVEAEAQSYTYAMAAGDDTLGILWGTSTGVAFTSRTP